MTTASILSTGSLAMQNGINRTAVAAGRIANGIANDQADLASNIVGLKQGAIDVQAAAMVVKVGDQVIGSLLDIRA